MCIRDSLFSIGLIPNDHSDLPGAKAHEFGKIFGVGEEVDQVDDGRGDIFIGKEVCLPFQMHLAPHQLPCQLIERIENGGDEQGKFPGVGGKGLDEGRRDVVDIDPLERCV